MRRLCSRLAILLLLAATACATSRRQAGEQLHLASRNFYDALQFGDYQVIARRLLPELRTDFLARAYGVGKALSVLEFTTISANIEPDGMHARTLSRLSWYELPSTVVQTGNVFIDWKRAGTSSDAGWLIERIEGGPLPVPAE